MISFDKIGAGRPVVFLHSGLADRTMWAPQIPAFAERYTCYVIDLPGYGQSPDPAGEFSHATEIARFVETRVGEPAALVGASFGASQALRTAQAAPDLIGPLVLANSAIMLPDEISPELEAVFTEADAAGEAGDYAGASAIEIAGWVDGRGRPGGRAAEHVRAHFDTINRVIWKRHSENPLPAQLPNPDFEPARIAQPVLLIDGPYDFIEVRSSNQTLLQRLPNARYVSIPDTAHFPSFERPEFFNRIALDFLDTSWGI